jgi:hypothetical protein
MFCTACPGVLAIEMGLKPISGPDAEPSETNGDVSIRLVGIGALPSTSD